MTAVNKIMGVDIPLLAGSISGSSHNNAGFSPQAMIQNGILASAPGAQIKLCAISFPCHALPDFMSLS
jgi:hypothetical protein